MTPRPGGVMPRTNCGLSSSNAATLVSARRAPPPPREAADLPLDAAGARVIGRRREIDAPQTLHEILQMVHRGVGRFVRIASLIDPGIDLQAVATACRRHELPHAHRARATDGRV